MYRPVSYGTFPPVTPWASTTPDTDFDSVYEKITQGTADEVKKAKDRISAALCLTSEAFSRLMTIRAKDNLWISDQRNEQVKDEEWREVYSILVQAQKTKLFTDWRNEEKAANVLFGPKDFWFSLREPKEGDWPPIESQPFIDPDILKITDLPESTAGKRAIELWKQRRESLAQINKILKEERETNGFDAMLRLALGHPNPGDSLQYNDLDKLKKNLDSTDPQVVTSATVKITDNLYMTVEAFNRLILIKDKDKDAQTDPLKKPTAAEYAEVYAILTQSRKKKHEYHGYTRSDGTRYVGWIAEEKDTTTGVVYWSALKAKLPRWRATFEARQGWRQALRTRSSAPIIDPDLIGPGDLNKPAAGDPAYDLWAERNDWINHPVNGQLAKIKAARKAEATPLAGLGKIIENSLGVPLADMQELSKIQKKGGSIEARLEQLHLSNAAFSFLLRIRDLAANNQPILDAEWDQVYSILTQANKHREFAEWREEEKGENLILSPDYFKFPEIDKTVFPPLPPPREPVPWCSTWEARNEWQDTLQSRIDQKKAVIEALEEAVSATEEATLTLLRDDLIMAINQGGSDLDSKAKWVTDNLLIDAKAGGCHMTTRVAQAFETIQGLLWSIRTGQLKKTYPNFELKSDNFDDEWEWIGSYATWRAVMFVHMYPEYILLPSLRKHQTPAFADLVRSLRSGRRLTPRLARQLADTYADYLRDVCSLQLKGCCEAQTKHFPQSYDYPDGTLHQVAFLFGLASSNKAYWCIRDRMAKDSQFAQSYWDQLDGFSGPVIEIIGATVLLPSSDNGPTTLRPKVFVFAKIIGNNGEALEFMRYDLDNGTWDSNATPLEVPDKAETFSAVLLNTALTDPPLLEIHTRIRDAAGHEYEAVYTGSLNKAGNGWESDKPRLSSQVSGTWLHLGQDVSLSNTRNQVVGIRQIVSGDFDGDGRDELLVGDEVQDNDAAWENDFWFLDWSDGKWSSTRNLNCSDEKIRARYAFVGDIDGDGQDEFLVAGDIEDQNRFWVLKYNGTGWQHVGTPPGYTFDLNCNNWEEENIYRYFDVPAKFAVCGNFFDKNGPDEVAVAISPGIHEVGITTQTIYSGFWIFKLNQGRWERLGNVGHLLAAFECCTDPNQKVTGSFAVAGDFDGDGRDEIAVAAAPMVSNVSLGNNFWVMDYREGQWLPLGSPGGAEQTVFDLSVEQVTAAFAVVGDFDGDGRAELIIAPFVQATTTNVELWLADFVPGPDPLNPAKGGHWETSKPSGLKLSFVPAGGVASDFDEDGRDEIALIPLSGTSIQIADFAPDANQWQILPPFGKLDHTTGVAFIAAGNFEGGAKSRQGLAMVPGTIDIVDRVEMGFLDLNPRLLRRYQGNAHGQNSISARIFVKSQALSQCSYSDFKPNFDGPYTIRERVDSQAKRRLVAETLAKNAGKPLWQQTYLHEAFYFVPLQIALELHKRGQYIAALDWYRSIYDYSMPVGQRKIYYGLKQEESLQNDYQRAENWLLDPLNPHEIAATRQNAYTRFTLLSLIRCLLEYADAEFTRDTAESVPRARTLYLTALELLDSDDLKQKPNACDILVETLDRKVIKDLKQKDPQWVPVWSEFKKELREVVDFKALEELINKIKGGILGGPWSKRLSKVREIIETVKARPPVPPTMADVLKKKKEELADAHTALTADKMFSEAAVRVGSAIGKDFLNAISIVSGITTTVLENEKVDLPWLRNGLVTSTIVSHPSLIQERTDMTIVARGEDGRTVGTMAQPLMTERSAQNFSIGYIPILSHQFCIPPNPMLKGLRLRAELNLYKLRNCRNIAGMLRQLEPYAAPTGTVSGLPTIGAGGQLVLPGTTVFRPTPYRYRVLIERSKQLVQLAAQIEAAMLSAIEKRDTEAYQILKARQDVRLTRAGVTLQGLRVTEANGQVKLAELQQQRAQIQADFYQKLLDEDLINFEHAALGLLIATTSLHGLAAVSSFAAAYLSKPGWDEKERWSAIASGLSSLAAGTSTMASYYSTLASYERRKQEWEFQKTLAQHDVQIGVQQVKIAEDHVRVVGQEKAIADMQAEHAEAVVEFLSNKFTNVELYDWMSDILERVYSFFLQQATSMGKLAENQLAFERHETPPAIIQADYWEAPTDEMAGITDGRGPDRRGLTGSARLLQDIYQLDQYAFETDKRKLQLTKTISLARMAPAEFQRFRETGVITFETPMKMFDRDFPGHYLRLIKRVRTSVVALIPPTQGIKATLTTTSLSRVVIGGDIFQTVIVRRDPESVALTSSLNATGLFELEPQSEMLFPFEALGIDTNWEFRMPKAANLFDYSTIADVLITIEYTALNSFDYRQQVIQQLDTKVSADRPFSFRQQFADQWYDFHNPEQIDEQRQMVVSFKTGREDFPPNIDNLKIQHAVLYFARSAGQTFEVPVTHLRFTEQNGAGPVGGAATSIEGVISTRRGNAGSWTAMIGKAPIGEWELALPNTEEMKNRFKNGDIQDILFVITYSGRTPEWPA